MLNLHLTLFAPAIDIKREKGRMEAKALAVG
jgi:hypothetical protein